MTARFLARRVLVPVDFSEQARDAVTYAQGLVALTGGTLLLVHVRPPLLDRLPFTATLAPQRSESLLREWEQGFVRALEEEVARVGEGAPVESRLVDGEPAFAIARCAEEEGCDLIVLASHGRTGLSRALLGSVAERTARLARCPVLIVRSPGAG